MGKAQKWFEEHKDFNGVDCLIWPFSRDKQGRALLSISGTTKKTSRIMCEYRHGPPPTHKHHATHSCGKGHLGCVNGSHLRWATHKENMADMIIHGTQSRGERHGAAKLTEADVLAIRSMTGVLRKEIAAIFGVSRTNINAIMRRKSWDWL